MPTGSFTRSHRSPSSSSGKNSFPSSVKTNSESARSPAAPRMGTSGRRTHQSMAGVYGRRSQRSNGLSRYEGDHLKRKLGKTGINDNDRNKEPITANEMVTAMGRKRFP